MSIEKTVIFNVDNKTIMVADLPTPLRKQFELYDEFRERQHQDAINLELSTMATNVKQLQLQELVRKVLAAEDAASIPVEAPVGNG